VAKNRCKHSYFNGLAKTIRPRVNLKKDRKTGRKLIDRSCTNPIFHHGLNRMHVLVIGAKG
jgi:hypothetical protein